MRKIVKMRILALVVLTGLFILAQGAYAVKPAVQNIREKMTESVKYPDFSFKTGYGEVEIQFTLTPEGKIEIKKIKSTDAKLSEYVQEQVSKICCADVISPYQQHYKIKFRFRLV